MFFQKTEEPQEKNTRAAPFSIQEAKCASDIYINDLWKAIKERISFTDLSESPCAYTEAPAEGIFSIYNRVITGRELLNIGNAVALTRVSMHGPPPATPESAALAKQAMAHFQSKYGERYCTAMWRPGATSNTVKKSRSQALGVLKHNVSFH